MANAEIGLIIRNYFGKLETLLHTFNFERPGREESMGKDCVGIVAEGIQTRSARDQRSVWGPFPENNGKYTAKKRQRYGVELIGVRTGQMWSMPSLRGKITVEPLRVEMTYGTGDYPPTDAIHPTYERDMLINDVNKGYHFTQKKGPFYKPDETIETAVRTYFAQELDKFIRELNARS